MGMSLLLVLVPVLHHFPRVPRVRLSDHYWGNTSRQTCTLGNTPVPHSGGPTLDVQSRAHNKLAHYWVARSSRTRVGAENGRDPFFENLTVTCSILTF